LAAAVAACTLPAVAAAQGGLLLQGIANGELWSTNTSSNFLTRNNGRVGPSGQLDLWSAVEPWRGMFLYGAVEVQGGPARADTAGDLVDVEQLGVRFERSTRLVIDVGKMPSPVGAFAGRRFSTRNPLIGMPDGYPVQYPVGAVASGTAGWVDYRGGAVSLAVAHPGYTPVPDRAINPVIGAGITPVVGVRLGVSGTVSSYLNKSFTSAQLDARDWTSYHERIGALDAELSRGYLELHGEWARSEYDVPRRVGPARGTTYYVEAKYTISPRFFLAARRERNNYPFIAAFGAAWASSNTDFHDTEVGAGVRLSPSTLLKGSYRTDTWVVTPANSAFIKPGGHAVAIQLSQSFDVMDLVTRKR
jgi:hypothetical protein